MLSIYSILIIYIYILIEIQSPKPNPKKESSPKAPAAYSFGAVGTVPSIE